VLLDTTVCSTVNFTTSKAQKWGYDMPTLTYSLLDEQMTKNDKTFFKQLGKCVADYRKEMRLTQTELAETLGISQQLIAAYEAGTRKIPSSMLPTLARLFAISLEQLTGMAERPTKRGPASTPQRQIEQVSLMPRGKQKFISEMLDALIQQQQAS
jgi:transcriptional regulator with XRE-family HTH domain